ncbi:hypothetical protein GQ44DRAFT_701140 [Phaeosphaeriaceae sp. PMI808]|nr:hypothetical protein GQ44DRAFT_701140 [Phaeosphaeriaceae sp. PMI808]
MANNTETSLIISFGIFTLIAALASLHYRDSLCCLCFRSLLRAWHHDIDIEAMAGLLHAPSGRNVTLAHTVIELQPQSSIPLYLDTSRSENSIPENDH